MRAGAPTEVDDLLLLLRSQMAGALALGVLTLTWLWIPPVHSPAVDLGAELRLVARQGAPLMVLGLFLGISLALQQLSSYIVTAVGFSTVTGGVADTVYQASAACVGLALCFVRLPLQRVLWWLHCAAIVSFNVLILLCATVEGLEAGSVRAPPTAARAATGSRRRRGRPRRRRCISSWRRWADR